MVGLCAIEINVRDAITEYMHQQLIMRIAFTSPTFSPLIGKKAGLILRSKATEHI